MTHIDWDTFAARVPAGCMIRFGSTEIQGVLLETKPSFAWDVAVDWHRTQDADLEKIAVQYFEGWPRAPNLLRPKDLQYLIGSEWLSFDQIMA